VSVIYKNSLISKHETGSDHMKRKKNKHCNLGCTNTLNSSTSQDDYCTAMPSDTGSPIGRLTRANQSACLTYKRSIPLVSYLGYGMTKNYIPPSYFPGISLRIFVRKVNNLE
jgi:hypothetical protein